MSESKRPLLGGLRNELDSLAGELKQTFALRWELARLELQADLENVRWLVIAAVVALVVVLTSLPVLVICLAELLDGLLGISRLGWTAIAGGLLLLGGLLGGWLAWRRFRRRLVGLEQTLEELQEDLVWLEEWRNGRS